MGRGVGLSWSESSMLLLLLSTPAGPRTRYVRIIWSTIAALLRGMFGRCERAVQQAGKKLIESCCCCVVILCRLKHKVNDNEHGSLRGLGVAQETGQLG